LHVRDLKSIRKLDWPGDGLGWGDRVPDTVIIGGANGTGKTTLLEFLFAVAQVLGGNRQPMDALINSAFTIVRDDPKGGSVFVPPIPSAWVDLDLTWGSLLVGQRLRFLTGHPDFVQANKTENCFGFYGPFREGPPGEGPAIGQLEIIQACVHHGAIAEGPAAIYLSSRRDLALPDTAFKSAGKLAPPNQFAYRWEQPPTWDASIEALLYSARWADLNAKESGQPEKANHFDAYARAFDSFYEGSKQLAWTPEGELIVLVRGTRSRHGLSGLSDGEKQVIVLCAELLRRWRPGSLILIDEPELHLHTHFQARLLDILEGMQNERGGQVILATQSPDLWRFASKQGRLILTGEP
jgi:predicted ATPase